MPKTPNLGLELTTLASTKFKAWRESVNGEGEGPLRSNAQIIDAFAGAIYGLSGQVVLLATNWTDNDYTLQLAQLGANDAVFFTPATADDRTALENANITLSTDNSVVTFMAEAAPTTDVTIDYFISRGRANE